MAISIKDLVKNLSREEVLADMLTVAKSIGLPTTAWQSGEPLHGLLVIFADSLATLWNGVIVKAIRAGFLEEAEGAWLTLLAWASFGITRKGETFAGGDLVIENRGGGFYTLSPGDIRVDNQDGKTFTNITGGTLTPWLGGVNPYPTVTLAFAADEAGSASSTAAGGIKSYPANPVTAPVGVYVKAPGDTVEWIGQDAESDDSLKERCRLSTGTLSPAGAKSAYETVALSTQRADGTSVNVTRTRVLEPGGGVVEVYLASPTGPATGDVLTAGTDVYLANEAIQLKVVPAGITATVGPAIAKPVTVVVTVYVSRKSNVTSTEAKQAAEEAVAKFFRELPIGGLTDTPGGTGYVYVSEVMAKASESSDGIFKAIVTLNGGSSDIALATNEVAVPTTTVTAVLVTQ